MEVLCADCGQQPATSGRYCSNCQSVRMGLAPVPPTHPHFSQSSERPRGTYLVSRLALLGSSAYEPKYAGMGISLVDSDDVLNIVPSESALEHIAIPYSDLASLSVSGPGRETTDAGVIGGGFGLAGVATGMIAASVLNSLTRRSQVNSFVHLEWFGGEMFLHSGEETPEELRQRLSPVFVNQRQAERHAEANKPPLGAIDPLERLTQLGNLLERDLLSREEFEKLKARLLEGLL